MKLTRREKRSRRAMTILAFSRFASWIAFCSSTRESSRPDWISQNSAINVPAPATNSEILRC